MTRYYYQHDIQPRGGKIGIKKAFGKVKGGLKRGLNETDEAFHDKQFVGTMKDVGKFAEKQILPHVVSTAIPIASTALGALATTYGGPMAGEMASNLSSNMMEQYIPKKYQSKNPYVGMFGDALSMGLSGDIDPYQMQQLQGQFTGQLLKDMTPKPPKYDSLDYTNNFQVRPNINIPLPPRIQYNPDNPYQDIIMQMMKNMSQPSDTKKISASDGNADNDAIYSNAELGTGADSINNKISPYQQKEGSMNGLLGAGAFKSKIKVNPHDISSNRTNTENDKRNNFTDIYQHSGSTIKPYTPVSKAYKESKKQAKANNYGYGRGLKKDKIIKVEIVKSKKPKKSKNNNTYQEKISKVEIIKTPRHKKFSHAKNTALDQLIEASEYNQSKMSKKRLNDMIEKQIRMLTAEGF